MPKATTSSSDVRSMTGFARAAGSSGNNSIEVELRSVNHRHLEVGYRLPRNLLSFEQAIKGVLQQDHCRGKIDVAVVIKNPTPNPSSGRESVVVDDSVQQVVSFYLSLCKSFKVPPDHLSYLLAQISRAEASSDKKNEECSEADLQGVLQVVGEASKTLLAMRKTEGAWLVESVVSRLKTLDMIIDLIRVEADKLPLAVKERLSTRIQALITEHRLDEQRLATEVALIADRSDVSEELERLTSHIAQFRHALEGGPEGVGRKMDFLVQEIGRELNTIGSKAQDAQIQGMIVDGKAELEKIREQVQNIE